MNRDQLIPIGEFADLHDELVDQITDLARVYEEKRAAGDFPSMETMFHDRGVILGLKAAIVAQRAFIEARTLEPKDFNE